MTTEADQPIRICFIILRAYPIFNPDVKDVIGGAEVDLYLLATELAKVSWAIMARNRLKFAKV
jgi:hypothetical protein